MEIQIHNRESVRLVDSNVPYIIISVTDPGTQFTLLPSVSPYCKGVLQLKFADVDVAIPSEDDRYKPISSKQAELIYKFAKLHKDTVDLIIINCDAGISRSSGIAAALSYVFNDTDEWVFTNPKYHPNRLVYREILNAAGESYHSND